MTEAQILKLDRTLALAEHTAAVVDSLLLELQHAGVVGAVDIARHDNDLASHHSLMATKVDLDFDNATGMLGIGNGGTAGNTAESARANLGLAYGTDVGTVCQGNDERLYNARTPVNHSTKHKHGGGDEIAVATPAANAIPKAGADKRIAKEWLGLHAAVHGPGGADKIGYLGAVSEQCQSLGNVSGALAIDLSKGLAANFTPTANTTVSLTNIPTTGAAIVQLVINNGGAVSVNWPASVKWAFDLEPELSSPGKDVVMLLTQNGGQTWFGNAVVGFSS